MKCSCLQCIYPTFIGGRGAVGLLILRVFTGVVFILHGWSKIQKPFNWMGEGAPAFLQALAALSEFGGGIALIVGLLTPLASMGIACVMIGAMKMVHLPQGHPFVSATGPSFELAAVYLTSVIMLLLIGPGKLSLDACLFGQCQEKPDQQAHSCCHDQVTNG